MASADLLRAGTTLLDRYVLTDHLGIGLGGETWKAVPIDGGAPVAVKVITSSTGWRMHRDLLSEAAFLRELDHPNVVRYLGLVDLPGRATFLVTEFIPGGNLWSWVQQNGPCETRLAAALLLQIAQALNAVHARGILHRDLKPQNVLVLPEGPTPRLLVADFGISRRSNQNVASVTHVAGTPGYAAPEVWSGSTINAAVDVYGLGAIAWFLLTGRDPEPAVGSTHLDPARLYEGVPGGALAEGGLLALVIQMVSLHPGARPPLAEVCERLARVTEPAAPRPSQTRSLSLPGPDRGRTTIEPPPSIDPQPIPGVPPSIEPPSRFGGQTVVPSSPRSALDDPPPDSGASVGVAVVLALLTVLLAMCAGAGLWLYSEGGPDLARDAPLPTPGAAPPEIPASADPGPIAPAEPVAPAEAVAPVAPVSLPPVAPPSARTTPAPVSPLQTAPVAAPGGPISRLRVGIDAPNGLPADVTLSVTSAAGASAESRSTQVVLPDTTSGRITVSVRSATRTLAEEIVQVPPGVEVRVLCKSLAADFSGMRCSVRE